MEFDPLMPPYAANMPRHPLVRSRPLTVAIDTKVGEMLKARLGAHFARLEIDEEACADILRTHGRYSDIFPAKIAISSSLEVGTLGMLMHGETKATCAYVYMGSKLHKYVQPALPGWLSRSASETLAHELSHVADHQTVSLEDRLREDQLTSYRRVAPGVLAGLGASGIAACAAWNIDSPLFGIGAGLLGVAATTAIGWRRSRLEVHKELVEGDYSVFMKQPDEVRARQVQEAYMQSLDQDGPYLVRIVQQDGSLA